MMRGGAAIQMWCTPRTHLYRVRCKIHVIRKRNIGIWYEPEDRPALGNVQLAA